MPIIWKVPHNVFELLGQVKSTHHSPRLDAARITAAFTDSKPFTNNRFNWGSTKKFSDFNKVWQDQKYDFCILICSEVWHSILNAEQRESLVDLHMTRIEADLVPESVIENGKKNIVKDEYGRVKYTSEVKVDDEGNPKWKVAPLDLIVFTRNVRRYGLWCEELLDLHDAISGTPTMNTT